MLSQEMFKINKTVQGDIGSMYTIRWYLDLDEKKQREVVAMTRMCIERANPNQPGVDKVINKGFLVNTEVLKIFNENPYVKALQKATELEIDELGNSFIAFLELYRHFDEIQRKTICKDGCDHEWHNLTWAIRTNDIQQLVNFYSLIGLKPEYHKHGTTFSYSIQNGQSILKIYSFTKTQTNRGLGLRIKFGFLDFDKAISTLKEKQIPFTGDPEKNVVIVVDPDGRKIELYKNLEKVYFMNQRSI